MTQAKSKKTSKIIFITSILVIILLISLLFIIALSNSGSGTSGNPPVTAAPGASGASSASPQQSDTNFDPNNITVRDDPVIMTVDGTEVNFSEFNFYYYKSAGETIEGLSYPAGSTEDKQLEIVKNALKNGIDGKSFNEIIFEKAKNYCIINVICKRNYMNLGYTINEADVLFYKYNLTDLKAGNMEELNKLNDDLLYKYGVVRNEYIDIMIDQAFINEYKDYLKNNSKTPDTVINDFENSVKKDVAGGKINVIMDEAVVSQLKLPQALEQYLQ